MDAFHTLPAHALRWVDCTSVQGNKDILMGLELEINRAATVGIEARGNRDEDTFLIYDKAIALNPENANAWYNRACICALQDSPEKALSDLIKAIQLNSEEYKTLATSETDFKSIQTDPRFIERTQ